MPWSSPIVRKFARLLLHASAAVAVFLLTTTPGRSGQDDTCLACHGDATAKSESGRSIAVDPAKHKAGIHGGLGCTTCHTAIKDFPHPKPVPKVRCATCHEDAVAKYARSVHSTVAEQSCASCHGPTHYIVSAQDAWKTACVKCHEETVHGYERGVHAEARKDGNKQTPICQSCHGAPHEILPASDPNSRTHHTKIAATCGACHGQKFVMEPSGRSTQPFLSYQESVHGRLVAAGSEKAAVCTDCHGVHEILSASNPKSSIFKFSVPQTCGKCHSAVAREYTQSVHGKASAHGNWQSPVCTDCHGIHAIKARLDPNSSVSSHALAQATCAGCHESVRISQEFGVQSRRSSTYLSSYHGLASRLGSQVVANCASCHGSHSILPSDDPRSMTNRANLIHTCGQCHPGVTEKFVVGKVHIDAPLSADTGSVAVRWIRKFYLSMIFAVIGGMLLHNFIIWRKKAIARRREESHFVTRMTLHQQIQHAVLFTSFIVLVLTGFALKYPDSWLASFLSLGERVRGWTHRIAGVVLIGIGVYHLAYIALTRDGSKLLRDFLPTLRDATDVVGTMRHYLGLRSDKPPFARFNYAEKAEYWALVWGLIVMAATGIMLWAKVTIGHMLPRWWLDVATAIHFYEAVLASLAIVVWHFYQVFLDPDTYPMNWAWLDGKMPVEHYREEHALDGETILQATKTESAKNDGSGGEAEAATAAVERHEP
jgi:cytochrome b subunit of formate dehydrogenase